MRYSITKATSTVAMLRRHGRTPTDDEVLEAYRDLVAAKIERCLLETDERGWPLDGDRAAYLVMLILRRSEEVMCDLQGLCKHNNHLGGEHTRIHRNGGFMETCDNGPLCAAADEEIDCALVATP